MIFEYFEHDDLYCNIAIYILNSDKTQRTLEYLFEWHTGEALCCLLNKDYNKFNENDVSFDGDEPIKKIDEHYNKINLGRYKIFVDAVLLDIDDTLNTIQRYTSYKFAYDDEEICDFKAKSKTYIEFNDNNILSNIYHVTNKVVKLSSKQNDYNKIKDFINKDNVKCNMHITYTFTTFEDLFNFLFFKMVKNNEIIKKCSNCGKYFYPLNRSDTIYCNGISPQDNSKICKEYGAIKAYQINLQTDEAMGLYRKIYMSKQMMVKRNPDIEKYKQNFETYKIQSKKWKQELKDGKKSKQEYIAWLKDVKEKRV